MRPCPAILFTAAYGAGLATGLLRLGAPLGVATVALVAGLTGRQLPVLLGAAALVGRLSGELAWLSERTRCTAGLPQGTLRLHIRLLEPVDATGGRIAARPLTATCGGAVMIRWPRGHPAPAGAEAAVVGTWTTRPGSGGRPGGTLALREVRGLVARPSLPDRLRSHLYQASHRMYGGRAGMVDALILARRGGLDPELKDRFAWSGLIHLLAISGFHVGLITAWVVLLARLARLSRSRALVLAATTSLAYVGFLGWPAPATRAAALAVVLAHCRLRQRNVQATPLLSATCLMVLLVDPWAILDLGGWLSASALWGAATFSRWTSRTLGPHYVWRTLGSSVGATLATAPITAAALGTVAPVGVVLNFAAIPLAALAVPGVIASLVLLPLSEALASALAAGAGLALHLLELTAVAGAAVPWGHVVLEPGNPAAAIPWIAGLGVGLWAIGTCNTMRETLRRLGWVATAALWVGLLRGLVPGSADGAPGLTLHFLDVGQGDAAVVRTPGGRWLLIDAGPAGARSDAGQRVVAPFLLRQGARRVAAAFVSHAHADHLGGVPSVLRAIGTGLVVEPAAPFTDPAYLGFLGLLADRRIPWHPGRAGECFRLDGVSFTILHPEPGWERWGEDVNEDSLVLLVEFGAFQALFTGDAGFPAEQALAGRLRPVDLLKVGHHGSRGSTGADWLQRLAPALAVISVGRNDYGHPAPATMARLAEEAIAVRRTDLDGTISVTTDGRTMTVRTEDQAVTYDVGDDVGSDPHGPLQSQSGAACRHP